MEKRIKKDMSLKVGETLLEFFIRKTQIDNSTNNIINILSVLNASILLHSGSRRDEIFEFGNFFIANGYEERTRKAREKEFNDEAYILNKYYDIVDEIERQEVMEAIRDLTEKQQYEALTLTNEIFRIKEDKTVTLFIDDEPIEFKYKKSMKQHYEILKQELFSYIGYAIKLGKAGLVIRIKKEPKDYLCGVKIEYEKWRPIPVYEFIEEYEEGLDFSVMYTEITRKYN